MERNIQETGINGVCDNKAIRIDVGMSKGCGDGLPYVLEIDSNSELRVLSAKPLPQKRRRRYDEKEGIGFLKPEHGTQQIQVEALVSF
ncbi:hypothetical protein IFM89_016652 [Coptis chinensis]|uniref:Uncharacterized protein n=1 Tax=Coptis chinensis TaxID=261450 RepID=A0A835M670_9MAGN|nr:hypothetical protein IFM89_016652 [Coptis chinensis]